MQGPRVIRKVAAVPLGIGLLLTFAAAPAQAATRTTESSTDLTVFWTEYGETPTTVGNVRTGSLEVYTRSPYFLAGSLVSWNCPPGEDPLSTDGDDTGACDIVQSDTLSVGATRPTLSGNGVGNSTLTGSLQAASIIGGGTRSVPVNITWNVTGQPQRSTVVEETTSGGVVTTTTTETTRRTSTQTGSIAGVTLGDAPGDVVGGTIAYVEITVQTRP